MVQNHVHSLAKPVADQQTSVLYLCNPHDWGGDVESFKALERRKAALLDPRLEAVHAVHVLNIESCRNATAV